MADAKISALTAWFALPAIPANIVSPLCSIAGQVSTGNKPGTNGR